VDSALEVLIHTTIARDANLTVSILSNAGVRCRAVSHARDLSETLTEAGAIILSEETLLNPELKKLRQALNEQPTWSAIPIIVVTGGSRSSTESNHRLEQISNFFPNVTLLERPLRLATLITVVRSVFASRKKQFELKDSLEELKMAKKDAEGANEAKSSFLANMSHEIRTPLSAIMGFAELLKNNKSNIEERAQFLDIITRNGNALTKILDDILDLSKVEAGKLDVELRSFHFRGLIEEVLNLLAERASSKNIYLKFTAPMDLPQNIKSDPVRLRQILINIIGNAIKFTTRGGVHIEVKIKPGVAPKSTVEIDVQDTGPGLTEEQAGRLFKAFTQAEANTSRKFGGTGLGLLLSRRLANALGGDVVIKERGLGSGCTFTVSFVCEVEAAAFQESLPGLESVASKKERLAGKKILVVDDAPDNRTLMEIILASEGAEVATAEGGEEALTLAARGLFDVILMDLQMPGMDGFETLKCLQARSHAKPVIALTAHAMAEEKVKTRRAGFVDHVTKPVNVNELVKAVLLSLENR